MRVLLLNLILFCSGFAIAQSNIALWNDVSESELTFDSPIEMVSLPTKYRLMSLDLPKMKVSLKKAPQEDFNQKESDLMQITLPLPDGGQESFVIWETQLMQPNLAARYPNIKSYMGYSPKTGSSVALGYGAQGFHASIRGEGKWLFIDPYADGQDKYYISYRIEDDFDNWGSLTDSPCGVNADNPIANLGKGLSHQQAVMNRKGAVSANLRTFVMAIACTGEFAVNRGGTVDAVLSLFNTTVGRINQVWQPENGVKVVLYDKTDKVIFLNPNTDPYTTPRLGRQLVGLNQGVFDRFLNKSEYDIGHVMTNRCTDGVAGIASGGVCTSGKASGVTCNGDGRGLALGVMLHELGHQFSASHTWDNCATGDNNTTNRAAATAFEPGSGSTIMSYSGVCGSTNLGADDNYYHNASLEQFRGYAHEVLGSDCGLTEDVGNNYPELEMLYEDGFYIPAGTPFELEAKATDPDGDVIYYSWEQKDKLFNPTPLGMPSGDCPMWRSYPATKNPIRSFPKLNYVLDTSKTIPRYEVIADYNRTFNFTITARDNHPVAGGTVWDEIQFFTTDKGGPFRVTSQASDTVEWTVGEWVEITWDVAKTNEQPVNCQAVDILLSRDFGNTFSYILADNTPNDGSEWVFVPDVTTPRARIKIKASENIFYNVNSAEFSIKEATEPSFTATVSPGYNFGCIPGKISFEIETGSILGYDSLLTVAIEQPLPTGVDAQFSANQVMAGENATLVFDLDSQVGSGKLSFNVLIFGTGTDTVSKEIILDFISSDFSGLQLEFPENGVAGVSENPTFSWMKLRDADAYDIQIATNPAFKPSQIVFEQTGIKDTFYKAPALLEENTPYYWRVRPYNGCKSGEYITPNAFHTVSKTCLQAIGLEGESSRLAIPGAGFPKIKSAISILEDGMINDLNIINISGSYEPVKSLRVKLISPDSVSIILFEKRCSGSVLNFGFDDEASSINPCPSNNGATRRPQEALSIFNGKSIQGTWNLQVEVVAPGTGGGGSLEEWTLEYCADLTLAAPELVKNDTLTVNSGTGGNVNKDFLEVVDDKDPASKLTYTIVSLPLHGVLLKNSIPMEVGDQFTQKDINNKVIWYENDINSKAKNDAFTFTVRDSEGGWVATPKFNFKIVNFVSTKNINKELEQNIQLFPNPAAEMLNLRINKNLSQTVDIQVFNSQGVLVKSLKRNLISEFIPINISQLSNGVYFLSIKTEIGRASKRFQIAR